MTEQLIEIVEAYRKDGLPITDNEAEEVYQLCKRKMELGKVVNKEEYLPVLFKDELKNYLYRTAINATTMLQKIKSGGVQNVLSM